MGTRIKPEQLASEVMKGLEEYKDLAVDVMKKEIQETGKTVKQQISQTAPRKSGRYAKSWAVKKVKETSNSLDVVVHSRNRYQLTHLLENGHAKRGGGAHRAGRGDGHPGAGRENREGAAMTHNGIVEMLEETNLPIAYDHFAEGESPDPPFICFLFPGSDNFSADGTVYLKIRNVNVELYTDLKDPELETRLETVLDRHGIFYQKTEVWIEEEKLYEVLYQFETEDTQHAEEKE